MLAENLDAPKHRIVEETIVVGWPCTKALRVTRYQNRERSRPGRFNQRGLYLGCFTCVASVQADPVATVPGSDTATQTKFSTFLCKAPGQKMRSGLPNGTGETHHAFIALLVHCAHAEEVVVFRHPLDRVAGDISHPPGVGPNG
jgi:hypothetical protein